MQHLIYAVPVAVIMTVISPTEARAGGTSKTFIRNGTTQTVYVWVDNTGRGLIRQIPTEDGRGAQRLGPNEVACASETNLFDCPTLRVYDATGKCLYAKEVRYIPVVGDSNKWKWTGSELMPD